MLVEGYLFSSNRWYIIVIIPKSLTANSFEYELNEKEEIKKMINNFLIISCIGKDDKLGLRINKEFFIYKYKKKENNRELLVSNINNFLNSHKVILDEKLSSSPLLPKSITIRSPG